MQVSTFHLSSTDLLLNAVYRDQIGFDPTNTNTCVFGFGGQIDTDCLPLEWIYELLDIPLPSSNDIGSIIQNVDAAYAGQPLNASTGSTTFTTTGGGTALSLNVFGNDITFCQLSQLSETIKLVYWAEGYWNFAHVHLNGYLGAETNQPIGSGEIFLSE